MKRFLSNIISKLIVINISYGILDIFLSSFLVSYIMRSFTNPIIGVAVFYIFWAMAIWLGFVFGGAWAKRRNKMIVFRGSIILRITACMILGLLPLNMPVVIAVASTLGLADGAMNLVWHNIVSEKLTKQQLIQYSGYRQSVSHTAKMVLPVLIGALITVSSYTMMVWLVIPFSILSFLVSFALQSHPTSNTPIQLKKYVARCRKCPVTRKLLLTEFLRGFSLDRISIMMTMLIVYFMYTDFALGSVKSLQSMFIILAGMAFGRFLTPRGIGRVIKVAAFFIVATSLIFLGFQTTPVLIGYLLIYTVADKAFTQMMEMNMINTSNYNELNRKNKVEYFITRETVLTLGRLLNLCILFTIGLLGGASGALIVFLVVLVLMSIPVAKLAISVSQDINNKK